MNATESARRHRLQDEGVGGSRRAVMARRVGERRARLALIENGDSLPGWVNSPSMATPENIKKYLDGLNEAARTKAVVLLGERGISDEAI